MKSSRLNRTVRPRIAVVGGGFTGSVLIANLLRECPDSAEITLFEGSQAVGRGLAYGTENPRHLLNVRASNMSAFSDDPSHFLRWLRSYTATDAATGDQFVSRYVYGLYIHSVFRHAVEQSRCGVRVLHKAAIDIHPSAPCRVFLADGSKEEFDIVVLCIGNFPPVAPPELGAEIIQSTHFIKDPWSQESLNLIPSDEPVLIIGSGLTMADVVDSLQLSGHRGSIDVVSRHGLEPQKHLVTVPYPPFLAADDLPMPLLALFRRVRGEVKRAAARGFDWRSVIDTLRPLTTHIWTSLSLDDRRRFLRHLRPYWDVHRHRLAPANADTIATLRQEGRLRLRRGRISAAAWKRDAFEIVIKRLSESMEAVISARWIINCSGPLRDFTRAEDQLVSHLLKRGDIRPDALSLGLDVTPECRLVRKNGQAWDNLYTLGPTTLGTFWEIIAVPDIRNACAMLARRIAGPVT